MTRSGPKRQPESDEWAWLSRTLIETLHAETVSRFGGTPGTRDDAILESALARPRHLAHYGEPSVFELASAYGAGIISHHPFVDGNKRTGLLAARVFLFKHGYRLSPQEAETVAVIRQVAAGDLGPDALTEWLEANSTPISTT